MAFVEPKIATDEADISQLSIYLRSTKKWGKSTLFRDTILVKYGDVSKGILVECGNEHGDTLLRANSTHLDSYSDFEEFKDYVIENAAEKDIKAVAFDTVDEIIPIFEKEIIKRWNNTPEVLSGDAKSAKTIKSAYGGFYAGQKETAKLIKEYMEDIKSVGVSVWAIAHSKYKAIKDKGGTDEDGFMQITSNLDAPYESAFGDICDLVLTGVIDRSYNTKYKEVKTKTGTKKQAVNYVTDSERRLYFRGTTSIDAGSRFVMGAVPEYIVYTGTSRDFAKSFVDAIETGIKRNIQYMETGAFDGMKEILSEQTESMYKELNAVREGQTETNEAAEEIIKSRDEEIESIRAAFKACKTKSKREAVKDLLPEGKLTDDLPQEIIAEIKEILSIE